MGLTARRCVLGKLTLGINVVTENTVLEERNAALDAAGEIDVNDVRGRLRHGRRFDALEWRGNRLLGTGEHERRCRGNEDCASLHPSFRKNGIPTHLDSFPPTCGSVADARPAAWANASNGGVFGTFRTIGPPVTKGSTGSNQIATYKVEPAYVSSC